MDDTAEQDERTDEQPLLCLPTSLRAAFKEPFGPLYTDADELLADVSEPVITVGDIVTYTLETAGYRPAVALVDGRTEREPVDGSVQEAVGSGDRTVRNPQGTLTAALFEAIIDALDADDPVRIVVEGEEDLAAVPAVLAAPLGTTVVYGQPGEGMVAIEVTESTQAEFRDLVSRMDGDTDRALSLLNQS